MRKYDVIIIGGGPAGLFTAININNWHNVLIIEKNDSVGKKLLMSGAGRCNLTNGGEIEEFLSHYGENSKFIRNALKEFTNKDLIKFFEENGIECFEKENGKVFPVSEKSRDIVDKLVDICGEKKVDIKCNENIVSIEKKESNFIIKTRTSEFVSTSLVIATGGKSYPSSGSSGDGYDIALKFGHTIVHPKPSLAPVFIDEYKLGEISGVSLQQKEIYLYRNGKKIKEHIGDIGFTHSGISGPGILDFSRYIENGDTLKINFISEKIETFREKFISDANSEGKTTIKKYIKQYGIAESLIKKILDELEIDQAEKIAVIDKKQRIKLSELLCEYPFLVAETGGYNIAMATAGGVSLKEISPKTMESKKVSNLYFAGEVLDIDGDTGGYNIQAAFSTGYAVAKGINNGK